MALPPCRTPCATRSPGRGNGCSGPGAAAIEAFAAADRALLVSRGFNLATALELALKLKETCGLFAEAYSTADFMHGPLVLARADVPTLAIRPDGPMGVDVDATAGRRRRHAAGGRPSSVVPRRRAGRVPWRSPTRCPKR